MSYYTIIGIDPGKAGAIVLMSNEPESIMSWLLEEMDAREFREMVEVRQVKHAYIEKSQAMPGQGVTSMFTYGTGFGRLLGWCEALSLPFTLVAPREWTRELHKGCSGADAKTRSLQAAKRLFPEEDLRPNRNAKPHLGIVDALLIAEYGRRLFK